MSRLVLSPLDAVTPQGLVRNVSIVLENGIITDISPLATPESGPRPLAIPSFIDLHIHGAGGYGPEQNTPESLLRMSAILARQGVFAFCPTLYCARPAALAQQLRCLLPALGHESGAHIIGFHLEGPFISPEKPGVMKPQDIAPANLDDFKQIYDAAQGHISIVTLAPEVPGIDPIIEFCLQHHILVQAGHTNATYEQMQAACQKGVQGVTHWGNAMSGLQQRAPGALGAALLNADLSCEVIADGRHIHPALLSLLRCVKPISQITAITDALLPTGQPQGPFYANQEEVLLQDGVWKRKQDAVTAGSNLTMDRAFRQLLQADYSLEQAVLCTSTNAARKMSIPCPAISPSNPGNFVVLNATFEREATLLNGKYIS